MWSRIGYPIICIDLSFEPSEDFGIYYGTERSKKKEKSRSIARIKEKDVTKQTSSVSSVTSFLVKSIYFLRNVIANYNDLSSGF